MNSNTEPAVPDNAESLLARMRVGDRVAAAEFLNRFGDRIRCRIRCDLAPRLRRLFDTQDIMSTVARRLDELVMSGRLRADCFAQVVALVGSISRNAIVDKSRAVNRLRRVEAEDRGLADAMAASLESAERALQDGNSIIERAYQAIPDPLDKGVLTGWLAGLTHAQIGASIGLSPEASRWRWHRIRQVLMTTLQPRGEP